MDCRRYWKKSDRRCRGVPDNGCRRRGVQAWGIRQHTLILVSDRSWADRCDRRRGRTVGCSRSLCDVDVQRLYRKCNVSSLLGRKARAGHQRSKIKQRISNYTARQRNEAAQ